MTTNKPEIIGYVPAKDGKLRCGEDGFCLDEYTDQLRDNPAGLKLEPVILFREYEALQAECEKLRAALKRLCNIYIVDDYYSGEERERRLDEAVRRSIDAVGGLEHE